MEERPARRGRQAEAERNDRALLDAARSVFAAHGFDAPVSAIAERAGVGMGSLYRRYRSKTELLQRLCLLAMDQAVEAAEAALDAPDAWAAFAGYVEACVAFRSGALAPLAGTIATTPEMRERSRRSRDLLTAVVERARRDGGLRPDVEPLDVVWLIELLSRGRPDQPSPESDNVCRRLLTIALDGLRSAGSGRLPGTPPDLDFYVGRWRFGPTPGADPLRLDEGRASSHRGGGRRSPSPTAAAARAFELDPLGPEPLVPGVQIDRASTGIQPTR